MVGGAARIVQRLWRYCNILRDDGLSYPDYVEQLTYLLFLKIAHERKGRDVPREFSWISLASKGPIALHAHYSATLQGLGTCDGVLGLIFKNARNKIKDPAKLHLLVHQLVGQTLWNNLSLDVKGDAYEGLLEKNAQDTKSGAGQYFTPRPLIDAIVSCIRPAPGEMICDPACGTGGFLLSAHDYILAQHPKLTRKQIRDLRSRSLRGVELVEEVARLATMNLFLHEIGNDIDSGQLPITCADSLKSPPTFAADVVLTNPPFGVKGSITFVGIDEKAGDSLTGIREDFFVRSSNKQLNFIQHVMALLSSTGRAAVVVPDNVLFETGAAAVIRRRLCQEWDVHTLLRLPAGLFYAHGIKANVLFFCRRGTRGESGSLWVYDLRQNSRFSVKTNPITASDLQEFVRCYPRIGKSRVESPVWQRFAIEEILRDPLCSLDIRWKNGTAIKCEVDLAKLDELSHRIEADLLQALDRVRMLNLRVDREN